MYISSAYKIPIAFQSTVLQVKFKYKVVSGTPVMAGTSSNTYAAAIYDVDNNTWMPLVGAFNFVQSSGVGTFTGTTQVPYNSTQFQIAIYNPIAPTGASSLYVDDFYVGPQVTATGPAMNDFVSYTPTFTGFGTVTNINIQSRRVGDSLEVCGYFQCGTNTATEARMTLGWNGINANVICSDISGISLGRADAGAASATYFGSNILSTNAANYIRFAQSTSTAGPLTVVNGSAYTSSIYISVNFRVKIVGWSSNTVMSADTDTRVIAARFYRNTTQTGVNTNATSVKVNLDTIQNDPTGAVNIGSSRFEVKTTGWYEITGSVAVASTNVVAGAYYQAAIAVDGSIVTYGPTLYVAASKGFRGTVYYKNYFTAGQYIELYFYGDGNNSVNTLTISAGVGTTYLEVSRLSGPAVITATETVGALYAPATVPTGTLGAAWNFLTFGTKVKDSNNAYSGSTYTIPVSGQYDVSSHISVNATWAVGSIFGLAISIDGSSSPSYARAPRIGSAYTNVIGVNIEVKSIPLKAGQTVSIMVYCNATTPSFESSGGAHQFSIVRSGNY
jgi:hypothetical protein